MSEGSQVSKVTLCVKILKWRSGTKGRYRAARAAKKTTTSQGGGLVTFFILMDSLTKGDKVNHMFVSSGEIHSGTNTNF